MKKFDRVISLLSCGALLFGQGAFAGKKEARGNVEELPVVESVKKKRKRSKGENNLGSGKKPEFPGDPLVGKSDKKRSRENKGKNNLGDGEKPKLPGDPLVGKSDKNRSRENKGKNNLGDGEKPKLPGDPLVEKSDKKRSGENKGKNNLGGGEKPKLSGNPSGDPLLNWVKKHPYASAGGASVLSVASVIAARKIHDAISQPFKVAILGRKELREKFIENFKDNTLIKKKYIGEKGEKFVISDLWEEKRIGMRDFISRIIMLGTQGYNSLNRLIINGGKVNSKVVGSCTVFSDFDYVIEDSKHGNAHHFCDFDLSYDNWRIGGFDLGELPFLSKIWFGAPHVCIMLFDGNNKKDVDDMSKAFGDGTRCSKRVPYALGKLDDEMIKNGYGLAKIASNTINNGFMELPFLPIPVRVDSLEDGKSETCFYSREGGVVPEYLVYDPKLGEAAIPDGALEIMVNEDNEVENNKADNGAGFVNKYAGKGKAYSEGGHGAIIKIG